ncbi:unnamed protein product [Ranitomeya imitator]|uniref:Uncharacterized protein n=1 Tax=Ranitomeya imitator TaxID=111125 RepID=A0ABN9LDD2_9NEOB|nr:unnamed protein product [Ranitomeya imitator]
MYWKRFIDDVFLIWNGDEASLIQYFHDMNSQIPNLTFTISKDQHSVNFLDTLVMIKEDGSLEIDLYTKPTDRNSLLLYSSCHPSHVKQSLPKSQVQSVNPSLTTQRIMEMNKKFFDRSYPPSVLEKATQSTSNRDNKSDKSHLCYYISSIHKSFQRLRVHRTCTGYPYNLREPEISIVREASVCAVNPRRELEISVVKEGQRVCGEPKRTGNIRSQGSQRVCGEPKRTRNICSQGSQRVCCEPKRTRKYL